MRKAHKVSQLSGLQRRMVTYRENSGRSAAWFLSLIFNGLLFLLPIIAARVVIIAFSGEGIGQAPTPEALAETRKNMEAAFDRMGPGGEEAETYWSNLIDRELNEKDLSAARGFLLAAPQILGNDDVKALRAAANAEITGTEDERLTRAALRILPNATSAKYKAAFRPPSVEITGIDESTETEGSDPDTTDAIEPISAEKPVQPVRTAAVRPRAFSVLGDLEDLASNSRRWINNDSTDSFILRLTGLAAIDPATPPSVNIAEAASILKGARRAGRISDSYLAILEARLNDVLPENELRPALETALGEVAPMNVLGQRVEAAYASTFDSSRLARLTVELELINRIAEATSPAGAISMLEYVESTDDMRRARLIVEAGGDRAVALIKENGASAMDMAQSGIAFTGALILQIMMLVAIAIALFMAFLAVVQRSISSRPRKAAIY